MQRPSTIFADSSLAYLALLFLGLAWLVPDHYPPWGSFYNDFSAFVGLWLLLLLCARSAEGSIGVPRSVFALAVVSFVPPVQAAVGTIFFAGDAWITFAYLMGLALAVLLGFVLARASPVQTALGLAWLFVVGASLSALLAIHQVLDLNILGLGATPFAPGNNRPYGNLAQPNQLATLLCLGLVGLLYLHGRQRIVGTAFVALALLLIVGITLTQSRAPWLGAACLTALWLFKRRDVPQIRGRSIAAGLAIYAAIVLLWPATERLDRKSPTSPAPSLTVPKQRSDLASAGTHLHNWQEIIDAIGRQPWHGYGWNQVSVAHVQAAHVRPKYAEWLGHSHNLLLDLLVWNGLPLGLLLIAVLLWWLGVRARSCSSPETWFALAAIGFFGAHAMVEYPHTYAYFLLPVGLLAGLLEAEQPGVAAFRLPGAALWLAVIFGAGFMALIWYEYRLVEDDYRLMRFETSNIGPIEAEKPAPDIVLLTTLREDLRMARSLARPGMSDAELEWMRKIAYRYPWYSSLFRYSVSLALNGRREAASTEFRRLYDIYGAKPYADAKDAVRSLAETKYPQLKDWQLPPP